MNQVYFIGYDNYSRPFPNQAAGHIDFPGQRVSLSRTADGAMLRLDYSITLAPGLCISVSGITGEIGFTANQSCLALGVALDPHCHVVHTGYKFATGATQSTVQGYLQVPLSLTALEAVERLRQDIPPEFTVVMHGSVLVYDEQTNLYDACRFQVNGNSYDAVRFRADRDNWVRQVRNVSPMGSVLVEIPLAIDRSAPWNQVWKHLESAAEGLAQGGEMGSKHCISEVRQAIESWRQIEKFPTLGPKDRQQNKQQRLLGVADSLFHYCSLSVHADEHRASWSRADAILALTILRALLSARNP